MIQLLAHVLDNVVTLLVIGHLCHEPVTRVTITITIVTNTILDVGVALDPSPLSTRLSRPLPGGCVTSLLQPRVTSLLDLLPVIYLLHWLKEFILTFLSKTEIACGR